MITIYLPSLLIYQVPGAESFAVRVVASVDKVVEIKGTFP